MAKTAVMIFKQFLSMTTQGAACTQSPLYQGLFLIPTNTHNYMNVMQLSLFPKSHLTGKAWQKMSQGQASQLITSDQWIKQSLFSAPMLFHQDEDVPRIQEQIIFENVKRWPRPCNIQIVLNTVQTIIPKTCCLITPGRSGTAYDT